jgi:ABC-type multidrug transport system ATPase subunit/pSer/pThr/pTyr-binding forkhead associated (FHA) protein/ABC-type multidrug transport system permease subunit
MEPLKFQFFQDGQLIKKIVFAGQQQVSLSIGKTDTDIVYNVADVSRMHAQIVYDGNRVYIQDCNSTNGTYINGVKISSGQLIQIKAEDQISFSQSKSATLIVGEKVSERISQNKKSSNAEDGVKSLLQYLSGKDEIKIGRALECDVVLEHTSVSRVHATVRKTSSGKYLITDLGSLNGTFVNNRKITSAEVSAKDKIFIGRFLLNLESSGRNLSNESAVRATNICKQYKNGFLALKNTSFDIPSGGLIAIMGPSGCGKSTLLKVLNGDSPASAGEVYINGLELISNYGYLKTQIGYVPQDDIVHRELTVEQSLFYAAHIRLDGVSDEFAQAKIDQLLNELNIAEIRHSLVSAISGGQRKRVSIAVELLSDPAVLFLDEPTSPLDPQTIEEFMGILRHLSEKGTTVVLVTHKPDDLTHMDSVMFMAEGGHLIYYGRSNEYKDYFKVSSPVEVYANIAGEKAKYWINKTSNPGNSLNISQNSVQKIDDAVNPLRQFYWLLSRYFKIKTNDRLNSAIMLLQAPIIAVLICFIFQEIRGAVPFLMAVSAIWFGVNNAAREIVAEAPIYKRERMFNVLIAPYIFSKVFVLGAFALIQAIIFNAIICVWYSNSSDFIGWQDPISAAGWMFFVTVISSLFGLLISAISNSTEKVMSIVPIAVIPQIMLAGIIAKIPNFTVEFFSYLTFSRWGTEGFDHIQKDIVEPMPKIAPSQNPEETPKIVREDSVIDAYEQLKTNFHSSYNSNFGELAGTLTLDFLVILILGFICLIGIWLSLKKKDSI